MTVLRVDEWSPQPDVETARILHQAPQKPCPGRIFLTHVPDPSTSVSPSVCCLSFTPCCTVDWPKDRGQAVRCWARAAFARSHSEINCARIVERSVSTPLFIRHGIALIWMRVIIVMVQWICRSIYSPVCYFCRALIMVGVVTSRLPRAHSSSFWKLQCLWMTKAALVKTVGFVRDLSKFYVCSLPLLEVQCKSFLIKCRI